MKTMTCLEEIHMYIHNSYVKNKYTKDTMLLAYYSTNLYSYRYVILESMFEKQEMQH